VHAMRGSFKCTKGQAKTMQQESTWHLGCPVYAPGQQCPCLVPTHEPCLCLQYVGNSSYVAMQTSINYKSTTGKNVASWQAAACTTNYAVVCERPSYDYRCDVEELPPEPPASPYCELAGSAALLQVITAMCLAGAFLAVACCLLTLLIALWFPSAGSSLQNLAAAGLPTQNDTTYCPLNQTSCYLWQSAGSSYADVTSRCNARGGNLVSYTGGWH
jgi:hypothetical protein